MKPARKLQTLVAGLTTACTLLLPLPLLAAEKNTCTAWNKWIENSELRFSLTHSQVPGQLAVTQHRLNVAGNHYKLESVSEAKGLLALMFSGQLTQKSEGLVDNKEGLTPLYYAEKRGKKPLTETAINLDTQEVVFKKNETKAPLERGLQDRLSMIYQISALLRCSPTFKKGDALPLRIMGTGRISTEQFTVLDTNTSISLDVGSGKKTVQLIELESKPEHAEDDIIRLSFAKQLNGLPVKIQITDREGQSVTQTLIGLHAITPSN